MKASEDEKIVKELNSSSSTSSLRRLKFQLFPSKRSAEAAPLADCDNGASPGEQQKQTPRGWKSMPFILGNETFERLSSIGMVANLMMYLSTQFNMDIVSASTVVNVWFGFTNFSPLLGAFFSDAYFGRFHTIAFASFASLIGMMIMTTIAWLPRLHPRPCSGDKIQSHQHCSGPTGFQFSILVISLSFLVVGSGGIRPCSLPFGVDQFDGETEHGRKGISSFFNWYYTTFTLVLILAVTLMVYIQNSVGWVWAFAILTLLMFCSIVLFFVGVKLYVYVKPEGSVFSGLFHVAAAAWKKRNVHVPSSDGDGEGAGFYDPPPLKTTRVQKLPLTNKYRFLNKAAIIRDGEIQPDGSNLNPWRLCSIQQVEEFKCLLKIIPIWASGIICSAAIGQQMTFTISQALKMDRHLSHTFEIPAPSLLVVSMLTVGIWVPIYDRFLVPYLRKLTKLEGGITVLQRMGTGIVFSVMSMIASGLVEQFRRDSALSHGRPDGLAPITVFWLAPPLVLMGFAEAFNVIGQIEFYNREFPENMSSLANSLFSCTMAGGSYLSSVAVNVVHKFTGRNGNPDWLTGDINAGKLDYYYYLIAGLGALNMGYFLWVSRDYQYKSRMRLVEEGEDDEKSRFGIEIAVVKPTC